MKTKSAAGQRSGVHGKNRPPLSQDTEGNAWDVGDWGSFDESPLTSTVPAKESQTNKSPDGGWEEDDWGMEYWGQDKPSKAELAKKRREERRQKLQAQKEKRAAGGKGPLKLGAVKMQ